MDIQQFLRHHNLASNPFAEEDAQTDPVFKQHCIGSTFHPAWEKIYGDPREPATSLVFGEKGAGKTALRLQISRSLEQYDRKHPDDGVFVVEYDDFNPYLDHFRERLGYRSDKVDRLLSKWRLWDHMDAILSIAVTKLSDLILADGNGADAAGRIHERLSRLDRFAARDLLLLAACYDASRNETADRRWSRLRKALKYRTFSAQWDLALGVLATLGYVAGAASLAWNRQWDWLTWIWLYLPLLAAWIPWLGRCLARSWTAWRITTNLRVGARTVGVLRRVLMQFSRKELAGQPLPDAQATDDRYELLRKLQSALERLGFKGMVVLVDRIDEPHLINGSTERMKALLWPLLDNKLLKHPGLGVKLLLPIELADYSAREGREFHQRARLDKQNMIPSLDWTGEGLYDLANARIAACTADGKEPALLEAFVDPSINRARLIEALRDLRAPRHVFRFFFRLLTAHCAAHTGADPVWRIEPKTFDTTLALYREELRNIDRGLRGD